MDMIRHTVWPFIKTRPMYWWWILKYGGKKNIPPELVFGKTDETMDSLMENIMNAARAEPPDMTGEERKQFRDLIMKINELKAGIKDARKDTLT